MQNACRGGNWNEWKWGPDVTYNPFIPYSALTIRLYVLMDRLTF